jgi:hypothetical protein
VRFERSEIFHSELTNIVSYSQTSNNSPTTPTEDRETSNDVERKKKLIVRSEMDVNDENAPSMLNIDGGSAEACGKQRDIEPHDNDLPLTSKVIAIENGSADQTPIITSKKFIHKKLLVHHHSEREREQFSNANEIMSENNNRQFAHDEDDVWRPW